VKPEAAWQQTVVDLATLYRWLILRNNDARREVTTPDGDRRLVGDTDAAGQPDLILIRERVVWVELKAAGGRLRPAQKRVLEALRQAGQEVYVWWPQHLDEAREVLAPALEPKRWAMRDVGTRGRL
jgi:VRR-NUC domain